MKAVVFIVLLVALARPATASDRAPGFSSQTLSLPGIPAAMLPADLDGDGHDDLVVLVAYSGWTTRAEFEQAEFDDIEGLVEVMNVVDELVDRRELRVYPALSEGAGFGELLAAMDLDTTVHALATGHPGEPLVAITDGGAAAVRLMEDESGAHLTLLPLVTGETSFAGGGRFYPGLELLHDLDGDGLPELLLPAATGWSVYRGAADGFDDEPMAAIVLPEPRLEEETDEDGGDPDNEGGSAPGDDDSDSDDSDSDSDSDGDQPRPPHEIRLQVEDLNGDGRRDVLVPGGVGYGGPFVYRNRGGLAFAAPVELLAGGANGPDESGPDEGDGDAGDEGDEGIMYVGDLDGDGRAVAVTRAQVELYDDPGWRQEVEEAKRPLFAYAAHRLGPEFEVAAAPRLEFEATGYTFGGSEGDDEDAEILLPGGFQDLDGDGRQDLVAITLDFSVLPLVAQVLVVKRISLTMNFHVWCQNEDGGFRAVPGLDLSGKFKLDLDNLQVRHLSQFAGDFDGDGRADFVQLGRGKKVTIHRGRPGCGYPAVPDRTIRLERKLRHLGLARIVDLDGDGRSDLYVVHPLESRDREVSVPARVDLYLSRL